MARYKPYDYSQGKLIPVFFKDQILPGTFYTRSTISWKTNWICRSFFLVTRTIRSVRLLFKVDPYVKTVFP